MEQSDSACKFCSAMAPGIYTCPRCNLRYCSSECYKCEAHAACSELFYRECFMEGLQDTVASGEERHKIVEMLRRLENDPSSERWSSDSEPEDLADRLMDIDLDRHPERIWQRLTTSERQDFEQMVNDGRVASLISLWTPWWIVNGRCLVEEVSDEPHPVTTPPALSNVPEVTKLTRSGISDSLPFSVVNVLYGYAYVARLYNGDHLELAAESAQVLCSMSESLGRSVFPDAAMAVVGCLAQLDGGAAREHFISREYSCAVLNDVCLIIAGKGPNNQNDFTVAALSDCHRILGKARREMGRSSDVEQSLRQYRGIQKKLEFLISWSGSCGSVLRDTLQSLEIESCKLSTELAAYRSKHSQVKQAIDLMKQRKDEPTRPLITVISQEVNA